MSLKVNAICKNFRLKANTLHALKDISFAAKKGDVIGVIGKNGSGKSTLLKILSGIYKPTSGSVELEGTLLSILEVGTGFHPDLSGKENIYLNGNLLGMSNAKIDEIYEQIKVFSEIDHFIDEPIKNYSSGMYFRLAFSIVVHMDSDIVLLDEILSVGDESFRNKCLEKIKNDLSKDRIVIIASHDIRDLRTICNKGIFINKGEIMELGSFNSALTKYLKFLDHEMAKEKEHVTLQESSLTKSNHKLVVHSLSINGYGFAETPRIKRNQEVTISLQLEKLTDDVVDLVIYLGDGVDLFMSDSPIYRMDANKGYNDKGSYVYECIVPANLLNIGVFDITLFFGNGESKIFEMNKLANFRILPCEWEEGKNWVDDNVTVVVRPNLKWSVNKV